MKAFICFAILTVATGIPLKDPEAIEVPEGPIPFEMLRHSLPFQMPVWRDLPMKNFRQGDAYVAFVAIPGVNMLNNYDFDNIDVSGSKVNVVDRFEDILSNEAIETIPVNNADDEVKVVYSSDASDGIAADRFMYILPNEVVKTIPVNFAGDEVKVVYGSDASDSGVVSDDKLNVPSLPAPEGNEVRVVNVVDGPATFDLNNMNSPVDIQDTV